MNIDFVVAWVDGNDPEWLKQKNEYRPPEASDCGNERYRDMGILKYWFRAVERYAPWVNKVHFITWGHLPEWLNCNYKKLNIVKHSDYIPKEYLPTFSSRVIELNLHRIKELSEHFVYFNDDTLLNAPVPEKFFFQNGLPCDYFYATNVYFTGIDDIYAHVCMNCITEINKHFSYAGSFLKHFTKYVNFRYGLKNNLKNILKLENKVCFTGMEINHLPTAYLKHSFADAWAESPEVFDKVSHNKFRTPLDLNQYVFRYRQLACGQFSPVSRESRGKLFQIGDDNSNIVKALNDNRCKTICINDTSEYIDFEKVKAEIIEAYDQKLPEKSLFEL